MFLKSEFMFTHDVPTYIKIFNFKFRFQNHLNLYIVTIIIYYKLWCVFYGTFFELFNFLNICFFSHIDFVDGPGASAIYNSYNIFALSNCNTKLFLSVRTFKSVNHQS